MSFSLSAMMLGVFMRVLALFIFFLFFAASTSLAENHLAEETSPYLLQHKDNPVDWYPWGDIAFAKAKKEHKLIFLSIGYSTCHWCHVMAHESFENEILARLLNKYFVSIKVDREALPHVDSYYQKIYGIMNNKSGGWPLTIMMTADRKPFFSGTYVPLYEGYGSKGLLNIINSVTVTSHQKLSQKGEKVLALLQKSQDVSYHKVPFHSNLAERTINAFTSSYDFKNSGFTKRPKFPEASKIILLLKLYEITKNKASLNIALKTLDAMANGGIYDQIEGGFYRYSVDVKWEIPHFEKMLYTNAELLEAYALAYKHTQSPLYKKVIEETIAQIDKRFKINKVYMSASNADSENFFGTEEEGFYFMYLHDEVVHDLEKKGLEKTEIVPTLHYLNIIEDGNFDGEFSNPHITQEVPPKNLEKVKKMLVEMRKKRTYPFVDKKINTAWNALYIKGLFKARIVNKKYVIQAKNSLDALIAKMYVKGVLYHQSIPGVIPKQKALLEDYAFLTSALFEAYQASLEPKYLNLYKQLIAKSMVLFYKNGRWLESDDSFTSYATINQRAYANALAQQSINLLNYATVEADTKKYALAKEMMVNYAKAINSYPSNYPTATLASLMFEQGSVFIKSTKENLNGIDTSKIRYPFVYKHVDNTNAYLACKLNSCFSYDTAFVKVKKDIESLLLTQ